MKTRTSWDSTSARAAAKKRWKRKGEGQRQSARNRLWAKFQPRGPNGYRFAERAWNTDLLKRIIPSDMEQAGSSKAGEERSNRSGDT